MNNITRCFLNLVSAVSGIHAMLHGLFAVLWIVVGTLMPATVDAAATGIALHILCGLLWVGFMLVTEAGRWIVREFA